MTEDYLAYWGITKPPFSLTPDPDMLYLSTQHSECLMRLKYAIFSQKGGALLVSDNAGNGKTSVLGKLKNDLNDYYAGRVKVVYVDHPTLAPIEMIGEIAHQLGAELHTTEKVRALNYLRDRLFTLYNENIKVVVIVDEGQMLKDRADILGELRILLNFCVADSFLLTFIFSGQKPLDSVLREMPEFWQRLPVRFFLRNLDYNDTKGLIRFRIEQVGGSPDIFNDDAFEGIFNYSEGCPRIICAVADLCLVIGYAKGSRQIGFVEVSTACRDMESSGDGFHYYAFMKNQDMDVDNKQGRKKPVRPESTFVKPLVPEPVPPEPVPPSHDPVLPSLNSIACPTCSEENSKNRKFCVKCDQPLFRKCLGCGKLIDTISNECPSCKSDLDIAKQNAVDTVVQDFKPFDIMENGDNTWLQASGITLNMDERVIIVFPRGNFISSGPTIQVRSQGGNTSSMPCDIVLTASRVILVFDTESISSDLLRIDSCVVTSESKLLGKKHLLMIGFNGSSYKITLPYGSRKAKKILDLMCSFVRMEMLK